MLDTGANDTDLNENFSDQFPVLLQGGTRETREITGLGGTASVASVTVPGVSFLVGPTRVVLRPAHIRLQRTVAIGSACCISNIGRDVLAQTGEFALDLSTMIVRTSVGFRHMAVPSPRGVRSRAQATCGLQQWRVGKRRIITVTENDLFTEWATARSVATKRRNRYQSNVVVVPTNKSG